jgi:hypothetical protein
MDEILASSEGRRRYGWMPYTLWEADGILFGHSLSPTSEDVVISCTGCEGHSALYGGTLLLTKQLGKWKPVWYKAGIITRHCRRVSLGTGRQILFCEATDGGMGHAIHGLYIVDLTKPKFAWDSIVLVADSYGDPMLGGVQTQLIDRVTFEGTAESGLLVHISARSGRIKMSPEDQNRLIGDSLPKPKLSSCQVDLRLDGDTFKMMREIAAAGRLFQTK